ncbi:MAG: radical SAM protein [Candidatus Omnitrophica bacterium]|nr:radical SAM protein [Candidatus Omnitrophota bacterium]
MKGKDLSVFMSYIELYKKGILEDIKNKLLEQLKNCRLCPRQCKVNRADNQLGFCKTGRFAKVDSFFLHFGEEPELVGKGGSGTIFFSNCNLGCIYCQNYTISHLGEGKVVSPKELAEIMLNLQKRGAENINFVTPTHVLPQILEALIIAIEGGLTLPLVYNCGGYESVEILSLIKGAFDIYMPDIKYSDNAIGLRFSSVPDYWDKVKEAVIKMHNDVGDLVIEKGVAKKGLLVRHLVLPHRLAGSFAILDFIKENISSCTYVNIMGQYHPCYKAGEIFELTRRINKEEYLEVVNYAKRIGLYRGF